MSAAMQRGPNGIIWAIVQSAMIFPFTMGILFFGAEFNVFRGIGIFMLLAALGMFGFLKDNSQSSGKWQLLTLFSFLSTGGIHVFSTLPSFFPEAQEVSSVARAASSAAGMMAASVICNVIRKGKPFWTEFFQQLRMPILWKFVLVMQLFSLFGLYFLMYPGLDVMAQHGIAGMGYPLMVGSCIVIFPLIGFFFLKERINKAQVVAFLCCIGGLILICC